jgi:hypothetical protein
MCCPTQEPGLLHRNAKFRHATILREIIFIVPDPSTFTILLIQCQKHLYFSNAKSDGLRMLVACILTTFPFFLLAMAEFTDFSVTRPASYWLMYLVGML